MGSRQQFLPAVLAVVLFNGAVLQSTAAEPNECIKLTFENNVGARFFNVCNEMINIMYCVDNPRSPKTCSAERLGITTLVPLAEEIVPEYTASGTGEIYAAICAYPTAPVGWKPGPANPYECKKTCVMC